MLSKFLLSSDKKITHTAILKSHFNANQFVSLLRITFYYHITLSHLNQTIDVSITKIIDISDASQ